MMSVGEMSQLLGPNFEFVANDGALALEKLNLTAKSQILDIGTGSGNFAIYLASRGYDVLTGEPSDDRTQYARRDWAANAEKAGLLDKIRFQNFDAEDLPFDSETFDAVFFFGVLHHIPEVIRNSAIREALRVTKRSGVLVIFEPKIELLKQIWANDPDHPLAANPSIYLSDPSISELRIDGSKMDIFMYFKSECI